MQRGVPARSSLFAESNSIGIAIPLLIARSCNETQHRGLSDPLAEGASFLRPVVCYVFKRTPTLLPLKRRSQSVAFALIQRRPSNTGTRFKFFKQGGVPKGQFKQKARIRFLFSNFVCKVQPAPRRPWLPRPRDFAALKCRAAFEHPLGFVSSLQCLCHVSKRSEAKVGTGAAAAGCRGCRPAAPSR